MPLSTEEILILKDAHSKGFSCDGSYDDYYHLYKLVFNKDKKEVIEAWANESYRSSLKMDEPQRFFIETYSKYYGN